MLAPSNPFVSLDPILAVDGLRAAVAARRGRVVAITPMIGAQAVKGPLGGDARDARARGRGGGGGERLAPLAGGFVLDSADEVRAADIRALGCAWRACRRSCTTPRAPLRWPAPFSALA